MLKKKLPMDEKAVSTKLVAGGLAAIFTMTLVYPTDTIRRRLAIGGTKGVPKANGTIDCIKTLYRQGGMGIFYKGITLNSLKVGPQMAVQFFVYDHLKDLVNASPLVETYGLAKIPKN